MLAHFYAILAEFLETCKKSSGDFVWNAQLDVRMHLIDKTRKTKVL